MEKFTKEEKELLEQNPNIQAVLSNQVLYTKDFKEKAVIEYESGKSANQIFQEAEIDISILAYLCVLLDVKTTEVISYELSQTMTKELALGTIESGIEKIKRNKYSTIIHSDRGSQFTSKDYRDLLLEHGLTQSMSAPASPRDNAVIELFFGHLKDEICLKGLKTFEQVIQVIDDYMYYYNNERRQWNKSKMTPVEYRKFLLAS